MKCLTWQKFQGAWLSTVLVTIRQPERSWQYCQNWLSIRREIATNIFKTKASCFDISSLKKIEQFLSMADKDNAGQAPVISQLNQVSSVNQAGLVNHDYIILCLIPLMALCADSQEVLQELLKNCVLKSLITEAEQEDIFIWNNLLSLSFERGDQDNNVEQIINQALDGLRVKKSALPNKLEIVIKAWEQGLSLYQLAKELNEVGNSSQIAIALAVYCFASTPQHFELAVKRAEKVSLSSSFLTIALTATLSGAYNGEAGIPWNWRASANKQQIYQSESKLAAHMFEAWLGIYSPASMLGSYRQKFDAVAQAPAIQTRQALKIISQNNT